MISNIQNSLTTSPSIEAKLEGKEQLLLDVFDRIRTYPMRPKEAEIKSDPLLNRVTFYPSFHSVIEIAEISGLIFKIPYNDSEKAWEFFKERLVNVNQYRELCTSMGLDKLIIPQASIITTLLGRAVRIYVEEKLDVVTNKEEQMQVFQARGKNPEMREAIRQLTKFIIKTDYADAQPGNNPPLRHQNAIGLLDLENLSFGFNVDGITGWKGIVNLVPPDYLDLIETTTLENIEPALIPFLKFKNLC